MLVLGNNPVVLVVSLSSVFLLLLLLHSFSSLHQLSSGVLAHQQVVEQELETEGCLSSSTSSSENKPQQEQQGTTRKQMSSSSSPSKKFFLESFRLGRQPFKTYSPFVFCAYHHDMYPGAYKDTVGVDPKHTRGRDMGSDFSYKDKFSFYHGGLTSDGSAVPGFPQHPHAGGLSTLSCALDGHIDHFDSNGHSGRYGATRNEQGELIGDLQWMYSGGALVNKDDPKNGPIGGIQHCEMFPCVKPDKNDMIMFQIWILATEEIRSKHIRSDYMMHWAEKIPIARFPVAVVGEKKKRESRIRLLAGKYPGWEQSPLPPPANNYASLPEADVAVWIIHLPAGGVVKLPPAASGSKAHRALYVYEAPAGNGQGKCKIQGGSEEMTVGAMNAFKVDASVEVTLTAVAAASSSSEQGGGEEEDDVVSVLMLQGVPIDEPYVQHGPFVGTSSEQIQLAFQKYRQTQFGGWPWKSHDPVFPREQKRFAKYANGSVELPPNSQ